MLRNITQTTIDNITCEKNSKIYWLYLAVCSTHANLPTFSHWFTCTLADMDFPAHTWLTWLTWLLRTHLFCSRYHVSFSWRVISVWSQNSLLFHMASGNVKWMKWDSYDFIASPLQPSHNGPRHAQQIGAEVKRRTHRSGPWARESWGNLPRPIADSAREDLKSVCLGAMKSG